VRALALLITHRELLNDLPDLRGLERVDISGCALLCMVCGILQSQPNATDSEIKQKMPAEMSKNFDAPMLRGIAHIVPDVAIKDEFLGAIGLLRKREKESAMDDLLRKAKQNALTPEEKQLLQQMLQEKT